MNVLMGVNKLSAGGNSLPLYMSVIERILRELRENQQEFGGSFSYRAFKTEVAKAGLTDPQLAPLQQRLETLESFMVERQAKAVDIFNKNKGQNKGATQPKKAQKGPMTGNDWSPKVRSNYFILVLSYGALLVYFLLTESVAWSADYCRSIMPMRDRRDSLLIVPDLPFPLS